MNYNEKQEAMAELGAKIDTLIDSLTKQFENGRDMMNRTLNCRNKLSEVKNTLLLNPNGALITQLLAEAADILR